jgi:hypothetical protein
MAPLVIQRVCSWVPVNVPPPKKNIIYICDKRHIVLSLDYFKEFYFETNFISRSLPNGVQRPNISSRNHFGE